MASQIDPTTIDVTYPIAGQDNDTRGFHDNYRAIQNGLVFAKSEIETLDANIGAYKTYANTRIQTLDANLGGVVTGSGFATLLQLNTANANIGVIYLANINTQANIGQLFLGNTTTQANLGAYQTYANGNAATQTISINSINANLGAYQTYANGNAATQTISINSIDANVGAYQTYANTRIQTLDANLGTATANITTLLGNANTQAISLNSINANLGAYQTYANANIGALIAGTSFSTVDQLKSNVNTINANVGAYQTFANTRIQTLDANIGSTITGNGWVTMAQLTANLATINTSIFWSNAASQANLGTATTNITALQSNAAAQQAQISPLTTRVLTMSNIGVKSGNVAIDLNNGSYQTLTTNGNIRMSFYNWPLTGNLGKVTITATIGNTAHTISGNTTVANSAFNTSGITGLGGNIMTFPVTGTYSLDFTTTDGGSTVTFSENNPLLRPYNSSTEIITSNSSPIIGLGTTYTLLETGSIFTLSKGVPGQIKIINANTAVGTSTVTVSQPSWPGLGYITFYGNVGGTAARATATLTWSRELNSWVVLDTTSEAAVLLS
jgi:hypothetical protein